MRVGLLLASMVALIVLACHLWLPFAALEDAAGREVVSRGEMAERLRGSDAVPAGASPAYLLAGPLTLAVGGAAMLVALRDRSGGRWILVGGACLGGIGAAMALHAHSLWLGRGVASALRDATGAPMPAPAHAHLDAAAAGDALAGVVPVSSIAVVVLSILFLVLAGRGWTAALRPERGTQDMAARHARMAWVGAGVLLLVSLVPWVVQELPTGPEGEATYVWSAYDILQKNAAGQAVAETTQEAGYIPWQGLSVVIRLASVAGIVAVLAGWAGVAGRHLEDHGQGVFGRLLENVALAAVPAYGYLLIAGFLASFAMHDPTRFEDALTTGLPLFLSAAGGTGLVLAGLLARRVLAVEGDLVADDFPEPVVYD